MRPSTTQSLPSPTARVIL
ncbi:UNVERIFIED_CONTAM: hypothetical protein GTU68_035151 [Idotea baltica]|nr:hypothetical protein [Idotea baltica]